MSDLFKIFLTSSLTLIGGVILFILGEFVRTLVIIPLQEYKTHVVTILDRLDFYADFYTRIFNDELSDYEKAEIANYKAHMRSAGSQLSAKYTIIACKKILVWFGGLPTANKIHEAYQALIYLSNSILFEWEIDEYNDPIKNTDIAEKAKTALESGESIISRIAKTIKRGPYVWNTN